MGVRYWPFGLVAAGDVLDAVDPGDLHATATFAEPPARTNRPVRDHSPYFASQLGRALALVDRVNGDRVERHWPDGTPVMR